MKFTIDKSVLYNGINKVQRAAAKAPKLAVLQSIFLETNGTSLKLTATDLVFSIQHIVQDVTVEELGSALIPAKFFTDVLRKLSGTLIIETKGDKLRLECGDLVATVKIMVDNDFPEIPNLKDAQELYIPTGVIKTALNKTLFAVGTNEDRPVFTGVLFKSSQGTMDFVATDTHRLAKFSCPIVSDAEIKAIVPSKPMRELIKVFNGELIKVTFTDNLARFECNETRITVKLISGEYPNYQAVIPNLYRAKVSVSKITLKNAVERANIFSDKYYRIVKVSGDSSLTVFGSSTVFGEIRETIKTEHEGEQIKIAFSGELFLQAINAMSSEKISLSYTAPHQALVMSEDGYMQLLLPVRVEG